MTSSISHIKQYVVLHYSLKEIREKGDILLNNNSLDDTVILAKELYNTPEYQVRMLAVYLFGKIAGQAPVIMEFLKEEVSNDKDWRVQEMLAKAFDDYCRFKGYEKSLVVIKEWLKDNHPNVRRAVTEGLRIWTSRDYFNKNPQVAIELLSALKADESEYVRKSVGNALRDISKKEKALIQNEVHSWDTTNKKIKQTYNLATKFL